MEPDARRSHEVMVHGFDHAVRVFPSRIIGAARSLADSAAVPRRRAEHGGELVGVGVP